MIDIGSIQAQLRASAAASFTAVPVPPFTAFFNPDDAAEWSNYAIPDRDWDKGDVAALHGLGREFERRGRRPRFEFLEDFAPTLAPALERNGYELEMRSLLMVCTPSTRRAVPQPPGLVCRALGDEAPVADVQVFMLVQRRGFGDEQTPAPSAAEAEQFRRRFAGSAFFDAALDGQVVAVGSLTRPHDGVAEVAGIATLPAFRRRGIASALTAYIADTAFARGLRGLSLTAGDEGAGRVYARSGFAPAGAGLAYRLVDGDQTT